MKSKTNFQAVRELMQAYAPAARGIVTDAEAALIRHVLEIPGRDDLELDDIRDMAIAVYSQSAEAGEKNGLGVQAVMAKMDAMSAVTAVIDAEKARRAQPGNKVLVQDALPGYAVATDMGREFLRCSGSPEFSSNLAEARLFQTPEQAAAMAGYAARQYNRPMTVARIEKSCAAFPVLDMPEEQKAAETRLQAANGGYHFGKSEDPDGKEDADDA